MSKETAKPLVGKVLRKTIIDHISSGRVTYSNPHAIQRMKERKITPPQVLQTLRSGSLAYESTHNYRHRYRALRGKISVIFTFEYGLLVITVF